MGYYLIDIAEYENIKTQLSHEATFNLDKTKCIVHIDNGVVLSSYETAFTSKDHVNEWRWNPTSNEWQNWITTAERNTDWT